MGSRSKHGSARKSTYPSKLSRRASRALRSTYSRALAQTFAERAQVRRRQAEIVKVERAKRAAERAARKAAQSG